MKRVGQAKARQQGRRSHGERAGTLIIIASFVLGFAWMFCSPLFARFIPGLPQIVQARGWASLLFIPHAILIPGIVIAAVLSSRSRRQHIARLVEARGQLCLNCAYPLGDSLGFCPECGTPYDPLSLKRGWCRTYPQLAYEVDWPTASTAISGSQTDARPVSL